MKTYIIVSLWLDPCLSLIADKRAKYDSRTDYDPQYCDYRGSKDVEINGKSELVFIGVQISSTGNRRNLNGYLNY